MLGYELAKRRCNEAVTQRWKEETFNGWIELLAVAIRALPKYNVDISKVMPTA